MGAAQSSCCCSDKENMQMENIIAAPIAEPEAIFPAAGSTQDKAAPAETSPAPATEQETGKAAETAETAEVSSVCITFAMPDGTLKDINFTQKPLGIDFTRSTPPTVKLVKPSSDAHGVVEAGWKVMKVDGNALPSDFDQTKNYLKEKVGKLPMNKN
eukprot:TRINITY_DN75528_c0_g1_i1.p1 TRINITY_DN75528_c0_g1~~TRINITY_DN75528_c0_g1_i1.p1  ORF type:complete len:157 (+),score=45.45 TRINITY_DN75528_c0_g1_i1:76-546(+)